MGRVMRAATLCLLAVIWACGDEGPECERSVECGAGQFCVDNVCAAECDPDAPRCEDGICTVDGRCALDQPDPASGVCAAMVLEAEFGTPTVVLLIDQSGSMTTAYSGSDRWNVLRNALIHPTSGVVTGLQDSVRFGLTLYTYTGGATCPNLTTVPPALNNLTAISTVYTGARPDADTPTGESIDAVVRDLSNYAEPGPKFIIVATDGEPDTCAEPNPQNGQDEAVLAAQNAFDAGITLFFLSVGEGQISQKHLQDMANAGVGYAIGGTTNAPFYEAGDANQLNAAFDELTRRVLTCELTVNGEIDPGVAESGEIYLDGDPLNLGDADGWEPIDNRSFRLLGEACQNAQRAGTHSVTAKFGCDEGIQDPDIHVSGGGAVGGGCVCSGAGGSGFAVGLIALLARRRRKARR